MLVCGGWGLGVAGGWMPLSTCPQWYCNPVLHVFLYFCLSLSPPLSVCLSISLSLCLSLSLSLSLSLTPHPRNCASVFGSNWAHLLIFWKNASHLTGLRRYATASRRLSVWYFVNIYYENMCFHFKRFSISRRWPYSSFNILPII